jgi:hypothetical protein
MAELEEGERLEGKEKAPDSLNAIVSGPAPQKRKVSERIRLSF